MPVTINGFGTRYAGRDNVEARRGVCESCRAEVDLVSYNTRLWICALFIPIVPLGRKRVLDECPRCRRHRVAPLEGYRQATGDHLANCAEAYRKAPRDREVALTYAEALRRYGDAAEAERLLGRLPADFPDDAAVHVYVASVLEGRGEREQADRLFDRAYQLDPSYPPARHARVVTLIQQGRLGEARGLLLDPRSKPGERDPGLLFTVGSACQDQGDPGGALECFRALLAEHPQLSANKELRRRVARAEQSTGALLSILPPRRLPWGKLGAAAAGLVLIVGGGVAADAWLRRHQELHVVSAWPEPITVRVDDRAVRFTKPARQVLSIAEGEHVARIEGKALPPVTFDTRRSLVDRFRGGPLYILNPGGLAVIAWEQNVYAKNPRPDAEGDLRVHAGQPYFKLAPVDYPFAEFPKTISVSSSSSEVRKTRVFEIVDGPDEILGMLHAYAEPTVVLDYLERWLDAAPSDDLALGYAAVAARTEAGARAAARLRGELRLTPVNIESHRAYQMAAESADGTAALLAEYDGHLRAHPDDAALHYLRGRIEPDPDLARRFYERAMALDPAQLHAPRALAYTLLTTGFFAEAVAVLRPRGTAPGVDDATRSLYDEVLFAAGERDELEQSLRTRLAGDPDWQVPISLTELLVASGRPQAAEDLAASLAAARKPLAVAGPDLLTPVLRGHRLYDTGDLGGLAQVAGDQEVMPYWRARFRFWDAVERGELEAVMDAFAGLDASERGFHELVVAVVYAQAKLRPQAEEWCRRAVGRLAREEASYRLVAATLDAGREWTPADLRKLTIAPRDKATLLTLLGLLSERQRDLLLAEAARFDFSPAFPHGLLARARGAAASPPPAADLHAGASQ